MFPHLYTRCSTISTFGMCFHRQSGTHMCILIKTPKWQENAIVFPALITIVLGKHACVKNVFFFCVCVSSRLKSVAVFLAQAHPNRYFCQKLSTFRDQKLRKRHAARKAEGCGRMRKPTAKPNITST